MLLIPLVDNALKSTDPADHLPVEELVGVLKDETKHSQLLNDLLVVRTRKEQQQEQQKQIEDYCVAYELLDFAASALERENPHVQMIAASCKLIHWLVMILSDKERRENWNKTAQEDACKQFNLDRALMSISSFQQLGSKIPVLLQTDASGHVAGLLTDLLSFVPQCIVLQLAGDETPAILNAIVERSNDALPEDQFKHLTAAEALVILAPQYQEKMVGSQLLEYLCNCIGQTQQPNTAEKAIHLFTFLIKTVENFRNLASETNLQNLAKSLYTFIEEPSTPDSLVCAAAASMSVLVEVCRCFALNLVEAVSSPALMTTLSNRLSPAGNSNETKCNISKTLEGLVLTVDVCCKYFVDSSLVSSVTKSIVALAESEDKMTQCTAAKVIGRLAWTSEAFKRAMTEAGVGKLAGPLADCVGHFNPEIGGLAAMAIADLALHIDGFGTSVLDGDGSKIVGNLLKLLSCEEFVYRGQAATAITTLVEMVEGFGNILAGCPVINNNSNNSSSKNSSNVSLSVNNNATKMAKYLVECLGCEDDSTRCSAASAIACLVMYAQGFGGVLHRTSPQLLQRLCEGLKSPVDNTRGTAATALGRLFENVDGFGKTSVEDSVLSEMIELISDFLTSPNDNVQCNAAWALDKVFLRLLRPLKPLMSEALLERLACNLCACMASPNSNIRSNAAMALGSLTLQHSDFCALLMKNPSLHVGRRLCDCLNCPDETCKSSAVRVIAYLVSRLPDSCKVIMLDADASSMARNLCECLTYPSPITKTNAALAIGSLVWTIEGFGRVVVDADHVGLGKHLCECLVHMSNDSFRSNASWAIGSLVLKVEGFAKKMFTETDPVQLMVTLTSSVEASKDETLKSNAARAIGSLVYKADEFGKIIPEASIKDLATRLMGCMAGEKDTAKGNTAFAIAGLCSHVGGFGGRILGLANENDIIQNMESCLKNSNDIVMCNAAMAMASLGASVGSQRMKKYMLENDALLVRILYCLAGQSDYVKMKAGMTIACLVDRIGGMKAKLCQLDPDVVGRLNSFKDHRDRELSHWATVATATMALKEMEERYVQEMHRRMELESQLKSLLKRRDNKQKKLEMAAAAAANAAAATGTATTTATTATTTTTTTTTDPAATTKPLKPPTQSKQQQPDSGENDEDGDDEEMDNSTSGTPTAAAASAQDNKDNKNNNNNNNTKDTKEKKKRERRAPNNASEGKRRRKAKDTPPTTN